MMLRALAFTALAATLAAPAAFAADKPLTRADVEKIVKEYIDSHPGDIIEALQKHQIEQQAEARKNAASAVKEKAKEIFNDPGLPYAGNPKGDVVVAEFFDYHCGYCKKSLPEITKLIEKDSKVKVVFHEFPILSPDSQLASRAAISVFRLKPEKYFEYHTVLMKMQGSYEESKLIDEAKKLGVDGDKMKKEIDSDGVKNELKKTSDLARALSISGTPAFVIGDQLIPGAVPADELKKIVDEVRAKKK